jgi:hypothetical protein
MHHGCVADANDGEEGRGGVVADIAKLSVGREAYYTRELATDTLKLSEDGARGRDASSRRCFVVHGFPLVGCGCWC